LNSMLQCLSNNEPLTQFFLKNAGHKEAGDGSPLVSAYAELIFVMWSGKEKVVSPENLKELIVPMLPDPSSSKDKDSHEVLGVLLNGLREGLTGKSSTSKGISSG